MWLHHFYMLSLPDLRTALDNPQTFDNEGSEVLQEADCDPELNLTCAC